MGYQSKTYSLSDEVVEAIEAAKARGITPNQLLKSALLEDTTKTIPEFAEPKSVLDTAPPTDGIGKVSLPSVRGTKLPEKPTEVRSGRMVFRRKE